MKRNILIVLMLFLAASVNGQNQKWSAAKANEWYKKQAWPRGCNFQPSTAINQLEMFQSATFDPQTIDRELGWASNLGFNTMRVYLHHLLWTTDKAGFKKRLDQYLSISQKHGIKTIFVFFDDCWNDSYAAGNQPEPKPGVHNSGWVRDPGTKLYSEPELLNVLESYVKDVMETFKNDNRILAWDLYNEPGNNKNFDKSLPLLKAVFQWAKQIDTQQPITSAIWNHGEKFKVLNQFQLENSDIITYHNYAYTDNHKNEIAALKKYDRPIICSEYMARRNGSLFSNIMPLLKEEKIGAINWGFVSGKTNTIYAWDTPMPDGREPELWFHDILRKDGTPFSASEVETIKRINEVKNK
ncbi:glycoside hydrolase family 2 TIM barrel-domain containing protein [Pedobacter sandarakinus]|uniref:glycoside hydrolase family 2 TIM barrel-domain containing protein n=1 Tax=Pedobacter sandarakinus TaxID=353156 RepID=UPI002246779D|nr:glycoside hydrolase family 2 TIM barrel-domain containing protein [Pedobacter sandarakinus]MCX2575449.1 cellulase family glycosylhydrolase [Pedobacter sandarakinus]